VIQIRSEQAEAHLLAVAADAIKRTDLRHRNARHLLQFGPQLRCQF